MMKLASRMKRESGQMAKDWRVMGGWEKQRSAALG